MKVKVEKGGYMPERAHFDDAGIDFRTPEEFTLGPAGSDTDQRVVDLKVHVEIPIGYYGKLETADALGRSESGRDASGWGSTGK